MWVNSYIKEYFSRVPSLWLGSWREEFQQNLELGYGLMEIWGIGNGPVQLELECARDFWPRADALEVDRDWIVNWVSMCVWGELKIILMKIFPGNNYSTKAAIIIIIIIIIALLCNGV